MNDIPESIRAAARNIGISDATLQLIWDRHEGYTRSRLMRARCDMLNYAVTVIGILRGMVDDKEALKKLDDLG